MESYAIITQYDMFSGSICSTLSAPKKYKNPLIDSDFFFSMGAKFSTIY